MEDEFEEAYDGGIDSASEELEDTASGRRMEEPEAGLSFERTVPRQRESTSAEIDDDEEFVVKAPVTESKYDLYEDSQEGHDVEEEEKIIEVAREHKLEEGEVEEEDSLVIVKKELPRDIADDRRVLASPAHSTLGRSESGGVGQTEQVHSSSRNLVRPNYSGEEDDSDADAEDEYYENDEDEEDEDDGDTGTTAQLDKANGSGKL